MRSSRFARHGLTPQSSRLAYGHPLTLLVRTIKEQYGLRISYKTDSRSRRFI